MHITHVCHSKAKQQKPSRPGEGGGGLCTSLPQGGVDLLLHEYLLLLLLLLQSILLLHHELLLLLPLVLLLQTQGQLPLQLPWWTPGGGAEGLTRCGGVAAHHTGAASTLHLADHMGPCQKGA